MHVHSENVCIGSNSSKQNEGEVNGNSFDNNSVVYITSPTPSYGQSNLALHVYNTRVLLLYAFYTLQPAQFALYAFAVVVCIMSSIPTVELNRATAFRDDPRPVSC